MSGGEIAKHVPVQISEQAFAAGLSVLRAVFTLGVPTKPAEQVAQQEIYYRVLGGYMRDPEWQRVVSHLLEAREPRAFPTPGEILRAMRDLREATE